MSFDPPAPRVVRPGSAEYGKEVEFGATIETIATLEFPQHALQVHDGRGCEVSALAEAGAEQVVGSGSLLVGHISDGQTVTWEHLGWDEVPLLPFVGTQLECGIRALCGCQAFEKSARCRGHV